MKLPFFRKSKTLFVTKSGIEVLQKLPVFEKQNLLVRFNQTGRVMLNGRPIREKDFRRLVPLIDQYHPDAWKHADVHQTIVIYPKLVID